MCYESAQWERSGREALHHAVSRDEELSVPARRGPWRWERREKRLLELFGGVHSLEPAPAGVLLLGLARAGAARLPLPA